MSEASASSHIFSPYCEGRLTLELGYGGYRSVPHAWTMDLPNPYTSVGGDSQQIMGDCRDLSFLCDGALGAIIQCHVMEDFSTDSLVDIVREHYRVLEKGGLYLHNMPNERVYRAHCEKHGTPRNLAHANEDFDIQTFKKICAQAGQWKVIYEDPCFGSYSFILILKKL